MAKSMVALNFHSNNGIVTPFNFRVNANPLSSSLPMIVHSNRKKPQFSVQCSSGVFPSIVHGVEKLFSGFTKLIKPRRRFKSRYDIWDFMTYIRISRYEASQFAVDEFNRRESKALHLDCVLSTWRKGSVDTLFNFDLEITDETGRKSAYHAVVLDSFKGKKELLEFNEVEQYSRISKGIDGGFMG